VQGLTIEPFIRRLAQKKLDVPETEVS
jgi:hypothetical protein